MMTWRKSKFTYFKFSVAALLGLTMLISFSVYFMASRGAADDLKFDANPIIIQTKTNISTHLQTTTQMHVPLSGVPATISKQSYNFNLLNSLLAFSIISIPLLFAQLIFGVNNNEILSRKINLLVVFMFLLLMSLLIVSLHELIALSNKMEYSQVKYQKLLDSALYLKQKSVEANNKLITDAKVGEIIKFAWN